MFSNIAKMWNVFTLAERRKAMGMLILVVLMALVETLGVVSIMPFLSVLGRPAVIMENALLNTIYNWMGVRTPGQFIFALGIASMTVVIVSSAFKIVTLHLLNRFVHLERHSLSIRLLSRYLHQPYTFFLMRNSAVLAKNVLSEVDQLIFECIQPLSQLIAQGAVVIAMTALILVYDPATALVIVGTLSVLYSTLYVLVRRRLAVIGAEKQAANGQRYQAANEALSGIKDVKITDATSVYLSKFDRASRLFSRHTATSDTLSQSPLYLVEAAGYSMLIIIALILLLRSNDVAHVLPALGLYGFAAYRMLPAAQIMYRGFAKLRMTSSALVALHDDLTLSEPAAAAPVGALVPHIEIRLSNIRYAYPSAPGIPVLDGLNLTIPANSSVGIVGKSGAGKTTLMDVILGLLQPQEGILSVDGFPITGSTTRAWQRSIGYVPQQIYLADSTIAENIAFGVPREQIELSKVVCAAKIAQIHDFITDHLTDGYDTHVGDRGVRLSGGQRQRLGIARALYRDPPVLLMDEATSALDPETLAAINQAIRALSGRKTIVVIAHQQDSLEYCDKIIQVGLPPRPDP